MSRKKILIGIGGNLGSGKTTVAKIFRSFGAKIIDADKIAHQILKKSEIREKLVQAFGSSICGVGGKIITKKLAALSFASKKNYQKLYHITMPPILKEIRQKMEENRGILVIDAPLLFETKLDKEVDYSILVSANKSLKISRTLKKKFSKEDIENRLKFQKSEKELKKIADFVIKNNGDFRNLKKQCRKIWQVINYGTKKITN